MLWFHISDKEKENRISEKRRWKSYLSRHIYIYLQCSCYWAIQTKKILWMLTSLLTVSQKWSAGFFVFLSSPWVICHVSCMKMMILFLLKSIFLKSYAFQFKETFNSILLSTVSVNTIIQFWFLAWEIIITFSFWLYIYSLIGPLSK